MLSEMGVRSVIGDGGDGLGGEDLDKELGLLLAHQWRQEDGDPERELNIFRSGSAPPTVEGSLNAIGGLFGQGVGGCGAPDVSEAKNGNGFLTEEELRSSPANLSYYYANANLNPRLPPPVLSKVDWRSTQRLQAGSSVFGGIGDRRKISHGEEASGISLFSQQPGFNLQEEQVEPRKVPDTGEWLDKGDGLIGLSLGRRKCFADVLQDDLDRKSPLSSQPSRPASCNAFINGLEPLGFADNQLSLKNGVASLSGQVPGGYVQGLNGLQNVGGSSSHTFASVIGSSVRNATSEAQLVAMVPNPCLPPVGVRVSTTDKKVNVSSSFNGTLSGTIETDELIAALSSISLANNGVISDDISQSNLQHGFDDPHSVLFASESSQTNIKTHPTLKIADPEPLNMSSVRQSFKSSYPATKNSGGQMEIISSGTRLNGPIESQRYSGGSSNLYLKEFSASSLGSPSSSPVYHHNIQDVDASSINYGLNAYTINPALPSLLANHIGPGTLQPLFESAVTASSVTSLSMDARASENGIFAPTNLAGMTDLKYFSRIGNQTAGVALQTPLNDPLYVQYLKAAEYTSQIAANCSDPFIDRAYMGHSYADLLGIQKGYIRSLLQSNKQCDMSLLGKYGALNHGYYGNPAFGLDVPYSGSPLACSIASPVGPGSPLRFGECNMRFFSNLRNPNADPACNMDGYFAPSLLEEFKNNKTRCFELAEIAGHVVEFSADQYGSRFIQQKLETATTEEKNMVYEEIMPHALSLMTDVFGNYVVQKFFEHGSPAQRRELANQLNGHVLALSLQMYGCRVIQKAIEVVDMDQKTKMVKELDGHIMRCIRDQNGNHVIQKCIECVPQEEIQFIISTFYDQVVALSTHPYGCRVVQRVLEHCDDLKTQKIVMDEILQSVCMLAQDQYGNYVVQHVLEHGKPHERSAIIKQLAGQIVQMSQQKFASNVVEKCLTFGGLEERQILVNEMLGSTEENEPLQAMMKDQFANYVVQKVLETCDDQQRELILSRIKVHLNALKKYTYGKHIVARVEKLVAAGERRISLQSS